MQTRSRSLVEVEPDHVIYINNGVYPSGVPYYAPPGFPTHTNAYISREEAIDDDTGKDRKTFRDCVHYKVHRNVLNQTSVTPIYFTDGNPSHVAPWATVKPMRICWTGYGLGYSGRPSDNSDIGPGLGAWLSPPFIGYPTCPVICVDQNGQVAAHSVPDDKLDALITRSLVNMLPRVKPEANGLVNDLIEVKDFKHIPHTIRRLKYFFENSSFRALFNRRSLKAMSKDVADPYLSWSFGIAPVVQDILGVWKAMHKVKAQLDRLRGYQGQLLTTHYRCPMDNEYPDISDIKSSFQCGSTCTIRTMNLGCSFKYTSRMFHATLQYRYNTDLDGSFGDQLRIFADMLGVNLNPAIVWNAIRWTFILDWVVNVSSWLDQFKIPNVSITTELLQYCYSTDVSRTITGYTDLGQAFELVEDAYIRKRFAPDYIKGLTLSGLSLKELSLLVALGITRS